MLKTFLQTYSTSGTKYNLLKLSLACSRRISKVIFYCDLPVRGSDDAPQSINGLSGEDCQVWNDDEIEDYAQSINSYNLIVLEKQIYVKKKI